MNKKNTVKKSKFVPKYIVDITKCDDVYDTALAFAITKQKNDQPLSDENMDMIICAAMDEFGDVLNDLGYIKKQNHLIEPSVHVVYVCDKSKKKKGNIFKRFWNWLIGRK